MTKKQDLKDAIQKLELAKTDEAYHRKLMEYHQECIKINTEIIKRLRKRVQDFRSGQEMRVYSALQGIRGDINTFGTDGHMKRKTLQWIDNWFPAFKEEVNK